MKKTKQQTIVAITCVMCFGFVSATQSKIGFQTAGYPQNKPSVVGFLAKQAVVSVITPTGSLLIDCRHEDVRTQTTLLFTQAVDKPFLDITKNENIVQLGQVFILNEVSSKNDGYYMCAKNDELGKGKIVVELFVMEEENLYNSCSLKHTFEERTIEDIQPYDTPTNKEMTNSEIQLSTDDTLNQDHDAEYHQENATRLEKVKEPRIDCGLDSLEGKMPHIQQYDTPDHNTSKQDQITNVRRRKDVKESRRRGAYFSFNENMQSGRPKTLNVFQDQGKSVT